MSSFDVLFPIPTGGRNADDMGYPPTQKKEEMTDLELAQQALPRGWRNVHHEETYFTEREALDLFLAGMAKAREIDAGICDAQGNVWAMYCAVEIRSQGKK
jgi:hypothetical protein